MKKQYRLNLTHIVVHKTATRQKQLISRESLPYHYLVTHSGELVNIRPVYRTESKITVAWEGGVDNSGRHVDDRTCDQNETLFNTLVMLSNRFPHARILRADELQAYGYSNPGFDIKKWLAAYIPQFLGA